MFGARFFKFDIEGFAVSRTILFIAKLFRFCSLCTEDRSHQRDQPQPKYETEAINDEASGDTRYVAAESTDWAASG